MNFKQYSKILNESFNQNTIFKPRRLDERISKKSKLSEEELTKNIDKNGSYIHYTLDVGDKNAYPFLTKLPDKLKGVTNITIIDQPYIKELPDNLTIDGVCIIENTNITQLPKNLTFQGDYFKVIL